LRKAFIQKPVCAATIQPNIHFIFMASPFTISKERCWQ